MSKKLWDAIERGDVDAAKSIINSISPEELSKPVTDKDERTVLQRAVNKGLTEVVQLIIDKTQIHFSMNAQTAGTKVFRY